MADQTKLQEIRAKYPEYSDMSDADFVSGFHNKFYSDIPEADFYMRIGYSPQNSTSSAPKAEKLPTASQERSYPEELLRQLGLTGRYATEGIMTGVNLVGNAVNSAANQAIRGANYLGADIPYLMNTSEATAGLLDKVGLPKPENATERAVGEASKFLASIPAFGGAGKLASKLSPDKLSGLSPLAENYGQQAAAAILGGGSYGVAKEVAPNSPAVQLAASILGGGAGALGASMLANKLGATASAAIPTTEDLYNLGSKLYKKADEAGAIIKPEAIQRMGSEIKGELADFGYLPQLHPRIAPVLDEIERVSRDNITGKGVNLLRKVAGAAATSQDPSERAIGGMIVGKIDDMLSSVTKNDVIQGDAIKASSAYKEAAETWKKFRKSEIIDSAVSSGENRASASGVGGNEENAIRQNIRAILDNPKKSRQFTKPEIDAMKKVVRGGFVQNNLRRLGKFSPTSGTLAAGAGIGSALYGSPLAYLSAAGLIAKPVSEAMARGNVRALSELVRSGGASAASRNTEEIRRALSALPALIGNSKE